jgi:hypothetical protein
LAEDLQDVAVELRQFVEEEDATLGEADLAGGGDGAADDQPPG